MFKTGSPVKGNDFIDRKKHLPIFKAYLQNNQHVMIKAPRRFGKTSLIKQVFEHEKSFHYIYVDLRRATNLTSLANQILETNTPWLDHLRKLNIKQHGISAKLISFVQEQQQTVELKLEKQLAQVILKQLSYIITLPSEELAEISRV